jgi:hypothetical protein
LTDDGKQYLDRQNQIRRLSPSKAYYEPMLPECTFIINVNRPKPGWKIDIPWNVVLTFFLWQIDTLNPRDLILDETGIDSEMALARSLLEQLKSVEMNRKNAFRGSNRSRNGSDNQ